uniref:SREBP regulating gene protein n=1 Tax=Trichuris muris TaxID=70415 RepID=A0A5S6QIZ2_TRIMR
MRWANSRQLAPVVRFWSSHERADRGAAAVFIANRRLGVSSTIRRRRPDCADCALSGGYYWPSRWETAGRPASGSGAPFLVDSSSNASGNVARSSRRRCIDFVSFRFEKCGAFDSGGGGAREPVAVMITFLQASRGAIFNDIPACRCPQWSREAKNTSAPARSPKWEGGQPQRFRRRLSLFAFPRAYVTVVTDHFATLIMKLIFFFIACLSVTLVDSKISCGGTYRTAKKGLFKTYEGHPKLDELKRSLKGTGNMCYAKCAGQESTQSIYRITTSSCILSCCEQTLQEKTKLFETAYRR